MALTGRIKMCLTLCFHIAICSLSMFFNKLSSLYFQNFKSRHKKAEINNGTEGRLALRCKDYDTQKSNCLYAPREHAFAIEPSTGELSNFFFLGQTNFHWFRNIHIYYQFIITLKVRL